MDKSEIISWLFCIAVMIITYLEWVCEAEDEEKANLSKGEDKIR